MKDVVFKRVSHGKDHWALSFFLSWLITIPIAPGDVHHYSYLLITNHHKGIFNNSGGFNRDSMGVVVFLSLPSPFQGVLSRAKSCLIPMIAMILVIQSASQTNDDGWTAGD